MIDILILFIYTTYVAMLIPIVALFTAKFWIYGHYRGAVLITLQKKVLQDGKECKEERKAESAKG